jgi:hypothetical protein
MSGRTFGVQSLRWFGRPVVGVALWRWPGPEVLLSLLPEKSGLYPQRLEIFKEFECQSGFYAAGASHANVEKPPGLGCFPRLAKLQFPVLSVGQSALN